MTSILDNMKYLPKGLAVRIEYESNCTKGTLLHQWGDLYIQSNAKVRHIRHAWNSFLIYVTSPDKSNLRALSLEEILGHIYLDKKDKEGKTSLRHVLSWPIDQIKSCGNTSTSISCPSPPDCICIATCPPPVATAECTTTTTTTTTEQPCPQMPDMLRRMERTRLSALLDVQRMVYVEVKDHGPQSALLHPDGTFSYDDGEVGFTGLDSFELLWHYMRGFVTEKDPLSDLQAHLDLYPEEALRYIHFPSDTRSLLDRVRDRLAAPIVTSDPDPLLLLMARLEDTEAIYRRELRILAAIEEKQSVVADLERQVQAMKIKMGV